MLMSGFVLSPEAIVKFVVRVACKGLVWVHGANVVCVLAQSVPLASIKVNGDILGLCQCMKPSISVGCAAVGYQIVVGGHLDVL